MSEYKRLTTDIDLTGERFGRLLVISLDHKDKYSSKYWLCRCDCGNEKVIRGGSLKRGLTRSCGCLLRETARENTPKHSTKHGLRKARVWSIWMSIKRRCRNPKSTGYYKYGARGINVCDEWYDNFVNFYEWAINNGYKDDLTIDRKDNDGNYEPSNCRWVNNYIQANNKRNNIWYPYRGELKTLGQICRTEGIDYKHVYQLIKRDKYSLEKAIEYLKGGMRNAG